MRCLLRYLVIAISLLGLIAATQSCEIIDSDKEDESPKTGDTPAPQAEKDTDPNSPANSDSIGVGTLELGDQSGILIAKDIDGNLKISKVGEDGKFELGLDENKSYSVSVVTGALAIGEAGLWLLDEASEVLPLIADSLGMNTIPTSNMPKETKVDFGKITIDDDSATSDAMKKGSAAGLEDLGVTENLAEFVGANDDNAIVTNQFDVDQNGILDFSEDLFLLVSVAYDWRQNFDASADLTLDSVKNKFLDADTFLTKDFQSYGFLTFKVPESSITADTGVLNFPSVKICETSNNAELCTAKTSATVTNKDGSDPITYGELNTKAKKFGITTKVVVDDVENPFAKGTYSLEVDGKTLTVPNFTPRAVSAASSLTFPIVKIVESGGEVSKIDFKWMTRDPNTTTYRSTTLEELKLLFNASERAYGLCSFGVNVDGSEVIDGISCTLPYDVAAGSLNITDCNKKSNVTLPLKWADIATFNAGTQDAFDFTIRYFIAPAAATN